MADLRSQLRELAQQAHLDGGWAYAPGQRPHLEPTCFAILALSPHEENADVVNRARQWLETCAKKNGSYPLPEGREEAIWPTAMALFTKASLGEESSKLDPLIRYLLSITGRTDVGTAADDIHDIDLTLRGWPWAEGNFSWVEPTAWACLALHRAKQGQHPRVDEGLKLLLDRTFDEGGINYGNRHVLEKKLDPEPGPTALTLLALQFRPDDNRVQASIRYLVDALKTDNDLEHLCWGRIALTLFRQHEGVEETLKELDQKIIASHQQREETSWVSASIYRQTLMALALSSDEHSPFALAQESSEPLNVKVKKIKRPGFFKRFTTAFRSLKLKAMQQMKDLDGDASVHIATASDYNADLVDVLTRQYDNFREKVPLKGKRVVLKPNLVEYHRDKVINTHPNVIAAAIQMCQREGASEVLVAEGPGHWRNLEYLVSESGLGDVLRHYKTKIIDLNHDEPVKRENLGGMTGLKYLYLTRTIDSADVVISMPKLKTHHWAAATLSMKNLFGTMPGICYGWPKNELHWRGIDNSIVDIAITRTPDLAIVDGIVGMEGDGPLNGTPKEMGTLIMGTDLVAVDATCCRLMKLDPHKVAYLYYAHERKLGRLAEDDISQMGETIESLAQPFETLEHFHELWMGRTA